MLLGPPPPIAFGPPGTFTEDFPPDKAIPDLMSLKIDKPIVNEGEVVLPQALEEVLALKNQRESELGEDEAQNAENNASKNDMPLTEVDENTVSQLCISCY